MDGTKWLLALALVACSAEKEDQAKSAASSAADKVKAVASTAKDKAGVAYDRTKEAVSWDKLGEAIDVSGEALDRFAQRTGILEQLDMKIRHATEEAKNATTDAARNGAMKTFEMLTKARAAIAKRIEELKAAGTYAPRAEAP